MLVVAGLYLEKMEVSINFLILPGLSSQALPDFRSKKSRPRDSVQPAYLQLSDPSDAILFGKISLDFFSNKLVKQTTERFL